MSKVLFITDVAPTGSMTAGRILENLAVHFSEKSEIYSVVIGNPYLEYELVSDRFRSRIFWTQSPQEDWSKFKLIAKLGEFCTRFEVHLLKKRIQSLFEILEPDIVILVLQSQTVIKVASGLNYKKTVLVSMVWDDFSWWAKANALAMKDFQRCLNQLHEVLGRSTVTWVPSNEMGLELSRNVKDFGDWSVVFPETHYANLKIRPSWGARQEPTFTIGFAGQLYASEELNHLMQAIRMFNKANIEQINLRVYSKEPFNEGDPIVKNMGFFSRTGLIDELSTCDLLFLPYPFDNKFESIVKTSFPSKLSDYCATQVPILYYGPGNSAVSKILSSLKHPYVLNTASATNLLHFLKSHFLRNPTDSKVCTANQKLRDDIFDPENNRKLVTGLYRLHLAPKTQSPIFQVNEGVYHWFRKSLTRSLWRRLSFLKRIVIRFQSFELRVRSYLKNVIKKSLKFRTSKHISFASIPPEINKSLVTRQLPPSLEKIWPTR